MRAAENLGRFTAAAPHPCHDLHLAAQSHPQQRPQHRHPRPHPTRQIDKAGSVTLRVAGRLRHIGVGRTYARTNVILLVQDLHVTVIDAATGEILRDLMLTA